MSTIIRDINGNRTTHTLAHFKRHALKAGAWHRDSTGLYCMDYTDAGGAGFCAFIRPENKRERDAIELAQRLGKPRP